MFNKVPIIILAGFLGSGKTTLLTRALEHYVQSGKRPAVIMNEIGDVNLDGQLVDESIPMSEMLSGCICCTIRGDLGLEIQKLIEESAPDMILIEATGVANPMEILDAITDAALLVRIEVLATITVVDAAHYLQWHRKKVGKTYNLIQDQVRCASLILINKSDLVTIMELEELEDAVSSINPHAVVQSTHYCEVDRLLLELEAREQSHVNHVCDHGIEIHNEPYRACNHSHDEHQHHEHSDPEHQGHTHQHSYDHVMVYTHYFQQSLETESFKQFISKLPKSVYRAKGIFTSTLTGERMMFQYAYRQVELMKINPQGSVQDVAVFMGEQFSRNELVTGLEHMTAVVDR